MNSKRYKSLFSELTRIVNEYDPAGLIKGDAPEDEYSPEVSDILAHLHRCNTLEDTCNLVSKIFNQAFDSDFPAEKYSDLAEPIWNWWKSQQERNESDRGQ